VQGASFEQKDPLVIYKMEAYNLFEGLISHINTEITSFLLKGSLSMPDEQTIQRNQQQQLNAEAARKAQANRLRANNNQQMTETQEAAQRAAMSASQSRVKTQPVTKEKTVGRNEPCPCGSGKKFKNCHGK
jgi:preprotein translocase subunit SecA